MTDELLAKYACLFERPLAEDVVMAFVDFYGWSAAVRSVISASNPSVVCLQETKLELVSPAIVCETLRPAYQSFFFLPDVGTRGGILLAWQDRDVAISNPILGRHHITALVSSPGGDRPCWITGVYGPQQDDEKIDFLADLHGERASCTGPWQLGGDFNMILFAADKNNDRLNRRVMHRFRRFLTDHELRDLYMNGWRYTWSNERDQPTLVRDDCILCTSTWESQHPHCFLQCLSSAASDHCPLLVDCTPRILGARRCHFERFWPQLDGFLDVVSEAWLSVPPDPDPFPTLVLRLKATSRRLQSWSSRTIGNIALQLQVARELIACLDAAQDMRALTTSETWLRRKLKGAYLGLASLD